MDVLFAPWRLRYVSGGEGSGGGACIFCEAYRSGDDRRSLTLWRWERTFALLNRYPYTSGHAMIAPVAHRGSPLELDEATLGELMIRARTVMRAIERVYRPDGFNIGINVGEAGGAGIRDHVHLHVVPRWRGDTNFVTVTGEVRVVPESLEAAHEKLVRAIGEVVGEEAARG